MLAALRLVANDAFHGLWGCLSEQVEPWLSRRLIDRAQTALDALVAVMCQAYETGELGDDEGRDLLIEIGFASQLCSEARAVLDTGIRDRARALLSGHPLSTGEVA